MKDIILKSCRDMKALNKNKEQLSENIFLLNVSDNFDKFHVVFKGCVLGIVSI
ncbi:MAG: hypothetical protein JHC31_06310 [Sulfurihydrogenibium sp.]|nr:hypothetical protein [Sulfurihydrogenibium sp.]